MRAWLVGAVVALAGTALAGCLDEPPGPTDGDPIGNVQDLTPPPEIPIPDPIRNIVHVEKADVSTGGGIEVYGHYAYVPARTDGFYVVDLSNPETPRVVSHLNRTDEFYVRYVDVLDQDGRIIVVGAGQSTGMHFIDVTDAAHPVWLANSTIHFENPAQPVHNVAVLRGTNYVYNTPSTGQGGTNHIVDATNPEEPVVVGAFGDHGCHLTTVRMDLKRAYCAGVQESQIWDLTDPLKPQLVSRIDNPLIAINDVRFPPPPEGVSYPFRLYGLHHVAMVNHDGTVLMVGDEFSGGGEPGACYANAANPATGSASTPLGALWFFDIRDEKQPALLSWFSPPTVASVSPSATVGPVQVPLPTSCTAHLGSLVPGKEQVLMGWYASGIVLIDFSDPSKPFMVTRWNEGTDTWTVKIHHGWIVTGDIARGLDVLKFT